MRRTGSGPLNTTFTNCCSNAEQNASAGLRRHEMSFYSILFAGINPASGDQLAVGLFMRGAQQLHFAWSRHRTALIRELMGADAEKLLVQNLKALERKAAEEALPEQHGTAMQVESRHAGYELNEPYFHYLAKYSTNLLTIGPATSITLEAGEQQFKELFRLLVDDRSPAVASSRARDIDETKSRLKERIAARVNWDARITREEVPGLLFPSVQLDFVGRNGQDVIGEVVDFEKREFHLEADINKLANVAYVLQQAGRLGKAYVVGDEPDAGEYPSQHEAWKALNGSTQLELVPTGEMDRIVEHLNAKNVQPWRRS